MVVYLISDFIPDHKENSRSTLREFTVKKRQFVLVIYTDSPSIGLFLCVIKLDGCYEITV